MVHCEVRVENSMRSNLLRKYVTTIAFNNDIAQVNEIIPRGRPRPINSTQLKPWLQGPFSNMV